MNGSFRGDTSRIAEEAANWLLDLRDGNDKTRAVFAKWLRSSPQHVEEFLLVTASDRALQSLDTQKCCDVDALIAQLDANVVPLDDGTHLKTAKRHMGWRWAAGLGSLAASALLAIAWLLGVFSTWDTYTTDVGEQRTVQLTDGSLIHLNARSQVAVRLSDDRRDVRLADGEALFKVAHEASRPFRVETDRAVIRAVGTQFNVDRRSHDTKVTVIEGVVEVTTAEKTLAAGTPAQLPQVIAGEEIRIASSGAVTRSRGKVGDVIAWRQRRLVFSDSTLEEIAAEFNRYNRKQELVIADEALLKQRYGGTFEADEPAALLEFLRRTPGLAVEDKGDRLVIRGNEVTKQ